MWVVPFTIFLLSCSYLTSGPVCSFGSRTCMQFLAGTCLCPAMSLMAQRLQAWPNNMSYTLSKCPFTNDDGARSGQCLLCWTTSCAVQLALRNSTAAACQSEEHLYTISLTFPHCRVSVSMKDSACSWVMPPGWRAALQMGLCALQCLNWQSWEQYLVI